MLQESSKYDTGHHVGNCCRQGSLTGSHGPHGTQARAVKAARGGAEQVVCTPVGWLPRTQ